MDDSEREHIEKLVEEYTRRYRILETRRAKSGLETPASVIIELEDIQQEIGKINGRLQRGSIVTIDLMTFAGAVTTSGAQERLGWSDRFQPTLPSRDIWSNELLPQLEALKQQLALANHRVVAVRPKAHLSAGYAFGYVFRETTGFHLWIEQAVRNTGQAQWWRTDEPSASGAPLELERAPGPSRAKRADTSVEISATPDVDIRASVTQAIQQLKLPIRQRIQFSLPTGTTVQNGPHALAMAQQVRSAIRKARNDQPQQTIHLFGALPIGLAVLLGAQLNACEPVQCYEFDRSINTYRPACLLMPS
ncbi:MAG: SAVED domain-containing protein [Roseiflexaceae bacterium]|nr:SAVED domain-containing protein [Roseiflexaceae bacterium]